MQDLDPQVVNMAKAIRQSESGGDFNAQGKSSEHGAYQFTEPTWNATAPKYGINVPLKQATPEQQNAVAYNRIKEWKDKGNDVTQIASMWNAGEGEPNAYTGKFGTDTPTHKAGDPSQGVNSHGARYDVPKYAESVAKAYLALKNGGQAGEDPTNPSAVDTQGYNPKPFSNPTSVSNQFSIDTTGTQTPDTLSADKQGLGSQLGSRALDASKALTDTASGKINPISGVLQTVGAGAGALGDVVNKGIELIPGVKWLEGEIGTGVSELAKTPVGQSVVNSMTSFAKEHPEISGDIGAGFNIATAIPILKGLGVIKNIAMEGVAQSLKSVAEKGFIKETSEILGKTVGGRKLIDDGTENIIKKGIVEPRNLPNIVNGKYDVSEALAKTGEQRSVIAEKELQPLLDKVSTTKISDRSPLEDIKKEALAEAKDNLQDGSPIEKQFELIRNKYGDYPSLAQLNEAKKLIGNKISESAFGSPDYGAMKNVRKTLQTAIEDGANKLGLGDVNAINAKMRLLYNADKILENMNGKAVKSGVVSKMARGMISGGAGMLADKLGGGVVGGAATGYITNILDKGVQNSGSIIRSGILKRTGVDAIKTPFKKVVKRTAGLIGGSLSQKANQ